MIRSCSNQDIEIVIKPRTFEHKIDQPKRIIRMFLRRSRSSSEKVHNRENLTVRPPVRSPANGRNSCRESESTLVRAREHSARPPLPVSLSPSNVRSTTVKCPDREILLVLGHIARKHSCSVAQDLKLGTCWRIVNRKERIVHDQAPRPAERTITSLRGDTTQHARTQPSLPMPYAILCGRAAGRVRKTRKTWCLLLFCAEKNRGRGAVSRRRVLCNPSCFADVNQGRCSKDLAIGELLGPLRSGNRTQMEFVHNCIRRWSGILLVLCLGGGQGPGRMAGRNAAKLDERGVHALCTDGNRDSGVLDRFDAGCAMQRG
ncbi:hypothetical protein GE09DRAFT_397611 [Coniochaeta sp. 2T2.1]|nr:hypothetical protein GE09DRAFT_397611 [Coniochaeta sp. 2T2.1]